MKSYLFNVLALCASVNLTAQECLPDFIGAQYQLIQETSDEASVKERHMQLWRMQGQVAHVYPQQQISEIWNQVRDGRVRPTRYFDQDKRAIEYAPGDLNRGKGDRNWQSKYQMIPDALLASMTIQSDTGRGCQQEVVYQRQQEGEQLTIVWLPQQKLVKSFERQYQGQTSRWQLLDIITDPQVISAEFHQREQYLSTDYADIGDNETDPFFRKMINLGFVSHGASGFYDASGNALESHHNHHH
ncbi:hypothetical protein [Bacterioplanoides sp.]|uniref:hypothetical protein n=1 Tax=Bacterioplanoides sp. TaxID=2066072 RepID=UPI003B002F56